MRTMMVLKLSTAMALALTGAPLLAAQQSPDAGQPQSPAVSGTIDTAAAPADTGGVAGTTTAETETGGLQEIIVTAQRRAENLQRAALAITAIPTDALVRAGVTDTTALTRVAPAIQIGTIGGTLTTFYLRGVGNFTANSFSDAAIAVNLDGVPIVRSVSRC